MDREASRRQYLQKRSRDLLRLRERQVQAERELLAVAEEEKLLEAAAILEHKRRLEEEAYQVEQQTNKKSKKEPEVDRFELLLDRHDVVAFESTNTSEIEGPLEDQEAAEKKELPIHKYKEEILAAISTYSVLILIGETGSGKSTQLPQFLLDKTKGKIAVTQPRRVAAMSVAERVAEEQKSRIGGVVGYRVRFDQKVSDKTKIEYVTDGMLLKQFSLDPLLGEYDCVIVDEAHERSVDTDLVLALVKEIVKVRQDFKVVVASATINATMFSSFFGFAPVFNVPGRTFPVDVFYTKSTEEDYVTAAALVVLQLHLIKARETGDVLVFLPGEQEIVDCISIIESKLRMLEASAKKGWLDLMVLPMYGSLSTEQQSSVFQATPQNTRKIIVSTNIAETSITVPGVVYVVDSGMVRQKYYSPVTGVEELVTVRVSKAAADQRMGRAGRNQPGKCYRLYTKNMYEQMDAETPPEILRCDLSQVLLQLKGIGIHDVLNFDWIQRPEVLVLQRALKELFGLGLLGRKGELTAIGTLVEQLPVEVKYGRCVVEAAKLGVLEEVVEFVSLLSVGSGLFLSRRNAAPEAAKQQRHLDPRRIFFRDDGDAAMLLEIFRQFEAAGATSVWCREHGVQFKAFKKGKDIKNQILGICKRLSIENDVADRETQVEELVAKALCAGFFMNSARLSRGSYTIFGSSEIVEIHPDSCLHRTGVKVILFTELVMTSRLFARTVVKVKPEWLIQAGGKEFRKLMQKDEAAE